MCLQSWVGSQSWVGLGCVGAELSVEQGWVGLGGDEELSVGLELGVEQGWVVLGGDAELGVE